MLARATSLALLKEYVDYSHCGEGSSFFGSVVAAGSFVVSGAGLAALGLSPSVATEAGVGSGDGVDSGVDSGVGVSVGGVVAFGAAVGGVVVGGAVVGAVAVDKACLALLSAMAFSIEALSSAANRLWYPPYPHLRRPHTPALIVRGSRVAWVLAARLCHGFDGSFKGCDGIARSLHLHQDRTASVVEVGYLWLERNSLVGSL